MSDPFVLDLTPIMTANDAPAPHVVSANSFYDNGPGDTYPPFHAFDHSVTSWNGWAPNNQPSGWIQYDFGTEQMVHSYAVTFANVVGYENRSPKNWKLKGSNDSINWTELDTQIDAPIWAACERREYPIISPAEYKVYRLEISSNHGGGFLFIGQIELLALEGEPDPEPEPEPEPDPEPEYVPPELYSATFPVPQIYARLMAAALLLKGGKKCLDARHTQSSIVPGVGYVTVVFGPHGYMNKGEDRILAVYDHKDGSASFEWIVNTNGTGPLLDAVNTWASAKIMEEFGLEGDAMSPQGSKIVNNHICIWNDTQLLIANMGMTPVFNGIVNPSLTIYDIDALAEGSLLIKGKTANVDGEYGCMELTYNAETGFFSAGPFLFR